MTAVFLKEIRLLLRSRKAFWFLMLALLAVGVVFLAFWGARIQDCNGNDVSERARLGRELFFAISFTMLVAMGLLTPLLSATSVTIEHENQTLDLLVSTGIRRLGLLLAKWGAAVFYQLALLVCLLPILSLVFQLGGVDLADFLFVTTMIVLVILSYGMLGLAFSCRSQKSISALVATLFTILILNLGIPVTLKILERTPLDLHREMQFVQENSGNLFSQLFWSVSPLFSMQAHTNWGYGAGGTFPTPWASPYFRFHLCFQIALFLFSLRLAWRAFAQPRAEQTRDAAGPLVQATGQARRLSPDDGFREVGDRMNPVYFKERCTGVAFHARLKWAIGLLFLIFSLIMGVAILSDRSFDMTRENQSELAMMFLFILGALVPPLAATAITREREEHTLDLLRVTPLSERQIVRGKFWATARFATTIVLVLGAIPSLFLFLMTFLQVNAKEDTCYDHTMLWAITCALPFARFSGTFFLPLGAFCAFFIAIGIYFSCRMRRNLGAVTMTYFTLCLMTVSPGFIEMAHDLVGRNPRSIILDSLLRYLSPLFSFPYFLLARDHVNDDPNAYAFWANTDHSLFDPSPIHWSPLLLHSLLLFTLAALLLRAAASLLRRERNSAP